MNKPPYKGQIRYWMDNVLPSDVMYQMKKLQQFDGEVWEDVPYTDEPESWQSKEIKIDRQVEAIKAFDEARNKSGKNAIGATRGKNWEAI